VRLKCGLKFSAITFQYMGKNNKPQKNTGEVEVSKPKAQIMAEASRIEESTLYSSKGHFNASHFWARYHLYIGIPLVVLSAVVGASVLAEFDPKRIIAGVLAVVITILSGLMTFLNPNQKVTAHKSSGSHYYSLMNKVRIFRTVDCWREDSEEVLTEKLKYFSEQKDKLNETCPQIPFWAYKKAKKGIEVDGEADFAVDKK
jgi:hypothetical protein